MHPGTHLYFHSPCFDGIVSAVVAADFLEEHEGQRVVALHPVNYHLRREWLGRELERPAAVVDFLYHPQADLWLDHHPTTFLTAEAEVDYERRKGAWVVYEPSADSCAGLLWRHLHDAFGYRKPRHAALVRWAEKTDAARYDSVEEAIESTAPALRINASLAAGEREGYGEFLVHALRRQDLDEVAEHPEVRARFDEFQQRVQAGLRRFEQGVRLEDDVVVFDVAEGDTVISRYAPYLYYRDARYSVGIVRRESGSAKITAMRNPWRDFESVHLGKIFEPYGGGGHRRVAAVVLRDEEAARAEEVLAAILTDIRSQEIGEIRRTA